MVVSTRPLVVAMVPGQATALPFPSGHCLAVSVPAFVNGLTFLMLPLTPILPFWATVLLLALPPISMNCAALAVATAINSVTLDYPAREK